MNKDPLLHPEHASIIQEFGELLPVRLGLSAEVRHQGVAAMNRLLAHSTALRDLYKKSHWQTSGRTFFELHKLFDKHHGEQEELMDALAERVQAFGGVSRTLAHDIVEETRLARGPSGIESPFHQLERLVAAHEFVLLEARPMASAAATRGDDGTNDLIVSQLIRCNERQSWFVSRPIQRNPSD